MLLLAYKVMLYKGGIFVNSSSSMRQNRDDYYNPKIIEGSLQGVPQNYSSQQRTRPRRMEIFLHIAKTGRLIKALLFDRRVSLWRKAFFFGSIGGLLFLLLFPDLINETVMSTVLPLAGSVIGVPLDAGFDWLAFAIAVVTLLRFFPAELVAEHYRRIFS
jgi:hypothetical protein